MVDYDSVYLGKTHVIPKKNGDESDERLDDHTKNFNTRFQQQQQKIKI